MRENASLAAWRRKEQTIGLWLSLANAYSAESSASLGFDWVCVDMQHGMIDYQDLTYMLPAISTGKSTPFVRVPWNEPYEIMKVLDAGAMGVIIPMVNNREEAQQAVMSCRYPPKGFRSFGPIRAALYGGKGYAQEANDQIACIAMIETKEGIEKMEEIITTPGLDGVYVGPSDLGLALGLPPIGDTRVQEHRVVVQKILDTCRKHGVAAGIHTSSLEYTQEYLKLGFHFVTLGSESQWMSQGAASALSKARGTQQEKKENTGY